MKMNWLIHLGFAKYEGIKVKGTGQEKKEDWTCQRKRGSRKQIVSLFHTAVFQIDKFSRVWMWEKQPHIHTFLEF